MIVDHMWYGGNAVGTTNYREFYDNNKKLPNQTIFSYQHVLMNENLYKGREKIQYIQGQNGIYFAGGYLVNDSFHESTIISGLEVAKRILINDDIDFADEIIKYDSIQRVENYGIMNTIIEMVELFADIISEIFLRFLNLF